MWLGCLTAKACWSWAGQDEDEVMLQALEAGADDVIVNEDVFEITAIPRLLPRLSRTDRAA